MSSTWNEYRFVIGASSPSTMPMARLAGYMADLARLLGESDHVHFVRIEKGSTVLVQQVDPDASAKVRSRIQAYKKNQADSDVISACKSLNERLADDSCTGSLQESNGTEIIQFPGQSQKQELAFGPFNQLGTLDGMLIRIGGRDDTVPVHLQDGDAIHVCNADRGMARNLAPHLFGPVLRVQGDGRWERDTDGTWLLKRFNIKEFELLDETKLGKVVSKLRAIKGSNWKNIDDPREELVRLRGSGDG